jgi:hypothetical protein
LSTAIAFFEDLVEVGAGIDVIERLAGILGVEAADLLRAPLLSRQKPATAGQVAPGVLAFDFLLLALSLGTGNTPTTTGQSAAA